jgi:hypothetical protein
MAQGMLPIAIAGLAAFAVLLIAVGVAMSGGSGGVPTDRAERKERPTASRSSQPASRDWSSGRARARGSRPSSHAPI